MAASRTSWTAVCLLFAGAAGAAEPTKPLFGARKPPVASASVVTGQPAPAPSVLDFVDEKFRDRVAEVLKAPTLAAKATDEEFTAFPKVYDWLLDRPDRTATAWQRLKVPCVDITDLGKGQFFWTDDNGSELTWQSVGKFENGLIWYANGKVKAGAVLPTVPVRAVAVLQSPRSAPDKESGAVTLKPVVHVYLMSDSRIATAAMRVMGPTATQKMAEQGAEQLLFFFSGIARYIHKKPDQLEALLGTKKK